MISILLIQIKPSLNCLELKMFALLIVAAVAVMATAEYVRMEPSVDVFSSANWLKESRNIDNDIISTMFVLKHDAHRIEKFEKELIDISTPSSPSYGKWLSVRNIFYSSSPKC